MKAVRKQQKKIFLVVNDMRIGLLLRKDGSTATSDWGRSELLNTKLTLSSPQMERVSPFPG